MSPVVLAQALGEYGGGAGVIERVVAAFSSAAQWVQLSLREDSTAWIAAAVCAIIALWLFRGR